MSEKWTPENVLNLFVRSLGHESEAVSSDVSATLVDLFKSTDPNASEALSKEIFDHFKGQFDQAPAAKRESTQPLRQAYRRSAALLTAFDPARLKPTGMEAEPGSAVKELIDDLVEVYDPPTPQQCWMLNSEIRDRVLKELGGREQLLIALEATPAKDRPNTIFQRTLEMYIMNDAQPQLERLPLAQLTAHLQAVRWLQPSGLSLPPPERIQEIIDQNQVPAIFEKMAGQNFVGREKELELLREYVEVLPPSTNLHGLRRQLRRWFGLETKPPLVIYSTGGAGKTTLISKFLLDHMSVPELLKFPYVYLDFDNPRLSLNDPNTILDEAVRQLTVQYPNARQALSGYIAYERARSVRQVDADTDLILDSAPAAAEAEAAESAVRFGNLVGRIVNRSGDEGAYAIPLLIVLDTYEEVQVRGFAQEIRLWNLLDSIQRDFPTLRIVVFGRAPLEQVPTSSISTTLKQLEEFDRQVADIFLSKLGVEDSSIRENLYSEFGGNPLSLKLAAEIYRREGYKPGMVSRSGLSSFFFFSASENLVQGQLYQRILGHIHDTDVRKLAHPGLVLRRITAELIKEVLQKPCGISVPDMARAEQLFEALGREVALVTRDADGALRHRQDVRRIMLNLLARDKPKQTKEINKLAVAYYSQQSGLRARAEEIYHRLQLCANGNEIIERWLPGVEEYLRGAIEEVPVESRTTLATFLGIRLKKEEVEAAGLAEWERYTARAANELVELGHYDEAMKLLRQRKERTATSPLYLIEAKALTLQKRLEAALKVVGRALDAASASGNRRELLEAVLLAAQLAQERRQAKRADDYLERAGITASTLGDSVRQILALLHRMRLRALPQMREKVPELDLRPEMARLLGALPDHEWIANKSLVRASVSLLGLEYSDYVWRMLMRVGLGDLSKSQVRTLDSLIEKLQKSPEVEQLTHDFTKALRHKRRTAFSENLTAELLESGRLDEFLQKLLPILVKDPQMSKQGSKALASLYLRQTIVETEEVSDLALSQ